MNQIKPHSDDIHWRGKRIPVSNLYDDKYYSEEDGLMEAQYVYLEQNQLVGRWKFAKSFCVGELGFGTGLNFLATWNLWQQTAYPEGHLHYISIEKYPLTKEQIEHALDRWPQLKPFKEKFLEAYRKPTQGFHRIVLEEARVTLTLLIGEAKECLENFEGKIDAWYLDGFAPKKNPEMWSAEIFKLIAKHSNPQASFSTFTAAGFVKRNLQAAGFKTEKFPGFGKKKDMLKGSLGSDPEGARLQAWHLRGLTPRALIIGAGLAGTCAAHAMAKRGWKVDLIDREKDLAQKASGNRVGIFTPLLTAEPHDLGKLSFIAYRYLLDVLRRQPHIQWDQTGALKIAINKEEGIRLKKSLKVLGDYPELARWLEADDVNQISGLNINKPAVLFSEAGWVSPRSFCEAQVSSSKNITKHFDIKALKLEKKNESWHCSTQTKNFKADVVILANGHDALSFEQTSWLPLRKVRGQAVHIEATKESQKLKTVLCYDGYMTPSLNNEHMVGATYDREYLEEQARESDTEELMKRLKTSVPLSNTKVCSERAALRTSTPGQTPIIGPALNRHGKTLKQLYLSLGHGSRGLCFAPLSAEIIASQVCGEPVPLDKHLLYVCSPQRHWDRISRS